MSSPAKRSRAEAEAGAGSDTAKPVLYAYWRSSCSWRVRIALHLKGIDYEYRAVHLLKDGGEQLKDDYAAMNPMKELPTLLIDGETLCQSGAILHYLEETRPTHALLPDSPVIRARVRQLCDSIGTDIQPVQNLRVLLAVMDMGPAEDRTKTKLAWGKKWIEFGFEGVEAVLATTAGKYCVGDAVTMADCYLVPQVYNAGRFGVDMSKFPTIASINADLSKLEAFEKAHPSVQPDAQ